MLLLCLARFKRAQSGFTLIELMIVGFILIILAVIALPVYADATDKTRIALSHTRMKKLSDGVELYRTNHGHYPDRLSVLIPEGYVRPEYLETPWSTPQKPLYYFYAVDSLERPLGYAIGDPGPRPERGCTDKPTCTTTFDAQTTIPFGRDPSIVTWHYAYNNPTLTVPTTCRVEIKKWTYVYSTLRACRSDLFTES